MLTLSSVSMLTDLYVVLLTWLVGGIMTEIYLSRQEEEEDYRMLVRAARARREADRREARERF